MLETHIRGKKQALLGNLRAFPPRGTNNEVWNHGIGKFTATYHAIPGKGERAIKLEVELVANAGSSLNGQDAEPRVVKYVYTLVYGLDGKIDETQANTNDWVSLSGEAMFAPLNVLEVVETKWQGHNPYITEANVRSMDIANGGNYGRFAANPPQWRAVGTYEAGRAPMFANRNAGGSPSSANASPRRGLFRIFGGR